LTVLCVLLLFTACSDDEEVIDPFLKTDLIGETINLGSDAVEAFDVKVITNRRDWEIASLGVVQWCNYEIIPDGENAIIRFSVAENEEATQRETEYRLTAPGCQPLKIKIVQLGTEYAILFDQSTPRKVTQEGEEFLLTVTSNVANEPTIEADMEGWVEIIEQPIVTRTFSDKIFKVTVHKNITFQNRTGHIKFVSTALKDPVVFTIIQEKASTEGMGDTKLKVKSAELIEGNVYGNQDVSKTIDGDYSTKGEPKASCKYHMVIQGLFSVEKDMPDVEFNRKLWFNGSTILYGIARAKMEVISTMVLNNGKISLPLLNMYELLKERFEGNEKKDK